MTPCEERGYKVGDKFRILSGNEFNLFKEGSVVELCDDDGTFTPRFLGIDCDGRRITYFVKLDGVEKIEDDTERDKWEIYRVFLDKNLEEDPVYDKVARPSHYQLLPGIEVYDVREAILSKHPDLHPCVVDDWSRSWEYLTRMFSKGGLEDAKKARWYLDKLIERLGG